MKRGKNILLTAILTAAITQSAYAAEIPVECAPENATPESIAITENLINPILDEVQNGLGYQPAWCKAHNAVFNAVLAGNTNGYGYLDLAAVARNALIYYRDVYLRPEYYAEKEAAAKLLLSDIISEVENGTKDYDAALKEAYTKIYQTINPAYQTINPAYVPNEEIGIDRIYLDIPAADTVMFTQARKLLKEAQTRSVQK